MEYLIDRFIANENLKWYRNIPEPNKRCKNNLDDPNGAISRESVGQQARNIFDGNKVRPISVSSIHQPISKEG